MNRSIKIIFLISLSIFEGFFFSFTFSQVDELVVQFEQTPLFSERNFLPGESVTRWLKVTNNTSQTKRIATEAINVQDPDNLASQLNLLIKEGNQTLYNNSLANFFGAGEVYLSDLAGNGTQTQYDLTIDFQSGSGNPYQGKSLSFDLLVGFQGEVGVGGGGGGGGGVLPPGLTIREETVFATNIGENSVTINWLTSYLSTSQVIYAMEGEPHTLDLNDNIGSPPKYGYARTTPEYDTSPKVTYHSVTIFSLNPGTTYYYRTVSHASLAISREYSFTTLGKKPEEKISGPTVPEEIPAKKEEIAEAVVPPKREEITEEAEKPRIEEIILPQVTPPLVEKPKEDFGSILLASLADSWQGFQKGQFFNNPIFWALLIFLGFLLSGLSFINEPRKIFGTLGFIGISLILVSSLFLPLPIIDQLRFPLSNFISYPIGILLFVIGLLIIFLAIKKISPQVASNISKSRDLVTSGVYKIARHPLYLGLFLIYFGWSLIFKALPAILFSAFVFAFLLILIFLEERDLLKTYGSLYQAYQKKVPWKIIPKVF